MKRNLCAALAFFSINACNATETGVNVDSSKHHTPHIVTTPSENNFDVTLAKVQSAIETRGFTTFAVIDHAAGAASVDKTLLPTTLIIFGNPKGGAPVMQAEQLMGLELPLKILVTESDQGIVSITHEDMTHLFMEYGITEKAAMPLEKMSGVLTAISNDAGSK